jgi:outer membrane protein assembly factor BamB/dienelactone hydrolase
MNDKRSRFSLVAVVVAATIAIAGPALATQARQATPEASPAVETGPSSMHRGNPARTGVYPGPAPEGKPVLLWRAPLGDTIATPAVGAGIVAAFTWDGAMVAYDQATGEERWRHEQIPTASSPAIADGKVFFGNGEGVHALDAATGASVWDFTTGLTSDTNFPPADVFDSSPAVVDGVLYIGNGPVGGLYALDAASGNEVWRFDTHGNTTGSPAVADGVVFIGTNPFFVPRPDPARLYAVDATTGTERWHHEFELNIDATISTPAVADGVVYITITSEPYVKHESAMYAFDATTGQEKWHFVVDSPFFFTSPAVANGMVYLPGSEDKQLHALDAATGKEVWSFTGDGWLGSSPAVVGDTVFVQGDAPPDGYLYALDAKTGAERWRFVTDGLLGTPAVVDGTIYVAGRQLVALTSADDPNAADIVSQPAQPATGPGSDALTFPAARGTFYGADPKADGFWIWEPTSGDAGGTPVATDPLPLIIYFSGCCGNFFHPTPEEVDAWLTHLARNGYVVIAPVYHYDSAVDDSVARIEEALAELTQPGHAAVDLSDVGAIGYSFGGALAVIYAQTAAAAGLPVPSALFFNAPCDEINSGGFCLYFPTDVPMPAGTKALVLTYSDDFVGEGPLHIFQALASLPAADRNYVTLTTDYHGFPSVLALHETALNRVDAADYYGLWKLSDALFACAFDGRDCGVALGNTPEQRYMGEWSDGVPVTELEVTEDPGPPSVPEESEAPPDTEATPEAEASPTA